MLLRRDLRWIALLLAGIAPIVAPIGCGSGGDGDTPGGLGSLRNQLSQMETTQIQINGTVFDVWLALDGEQRERGLMQVSKEELAPTGDVERGMLFAFPYEQPLSFWMFNTPTPLDIAYINAEGQIVQTHTMAPLETRTYPSVEPAQYALEVLAGTFERLHIGPGDHVEIPESVLKRAH